MNFLVPDLAIVPRLVIKSSFVIPIPESCIVNVLLVLFGIISILNLLSVSNCDESVKDLYLILSRASLAFEISSLIKISLFEYIVLIISDNN